MGGRGEPVECRACGRIGLVLRLRDSPREHLLVLVPELNEDDPDRRRLPEQRAESRVRDRIALAVGEDDGDPGHGTRREEAETAEGRERVQRRRAREERRARGRMLDGKRAVERRSEDLLVGAREEVWKDAIRQRSEAHPHIRHGRADLARRGLRAVDALRGVEVRLREHRAGDVEHDEGLGIRAHPLIARPLEDRLGCGEARRAAPAARAASGRRAHVGGFRDAQDVADSPLRRARTSATSGTMTPTASSAPSGVRIVNDIARAASNRCRDRPLRRRSSRFLRRRVLAARTFGELDPARPLECELEVVLRFVVRRVERDRELEVRDGRREERDAILRLRAQAPSPITPSNPAARDLCPRRRSRDERVEPGLGVVAQQGNLGVGHRDRGIVEAREPHRRTARRSARSSSHAEERDPRSDGTTVGAPRARGAGEMRYWTSPCARASGSARCRARGGRARARPRNRAAPRHRARGARRARGGSRYVSVRVTSSW